MNKDLAVERTPAATQMPDQPASDLKFNSTSLGAAASPPDIQSLGFADGLRVPKSKDVEPLRQRVALPKLRVADGGDDRAHRRGDAAAAVSAGEWADSLTNISVCDLLSEASRDAETCHNNSAWLGASLQHISLSCDSFDAAIAGLISRHQDSLNPPRGASLASILDAEETCDEFSFHKVLAVDQQNGPVPAGVSAGSSGQIAPAGSSGYQGFIKVSSLDHPSFGTRFFFFFFLVTALFFDILIVLGR